MPATKINISYLSNVHYQHPDLLKADKFLQAFGLVPLQHASDDNKIYYRGYGNFPFCYIAEQSADGHRHFMGGAFALQTREDLERAASLPGAGPIKAIDGPCGGEQVLLYDPADQPLRLTFGQERLSPLENVPPPAKPTNTAETRPRQGEFQRFTPGPSAVHKIGHFGRVLPQSMLKETLDWYTENFNLVVTDAIYNKQTDEDETVFMHIDLGEEYTDHHTMFLAAGPNSIPHVHHSSFEVQDMDNELLGHKHLEDAGYANCWGVGRHVLGSQIFDYWFDVSGNIIEHYTDSDVVNQHNQSTRVPAAPGSLAVWGPNVPLAFVTGRMPSEASAEPDVINSVPARGVLPAAVSA